MAGGGVGDIFKESGYVSLKQTRPNVGTEAIYFSKVLDGVSDSKTVQVGFLSCTGMSFFFAR